VVAGVCDGGINPIAQLDVVDVAAPPAVVVSDANRRRHEMLLERIGSQRREQDALVVQLQQLSGARRR
jgi:hypothetical protein